MSTTVNTEVNPSKIMQIGMGFWASKTLLTAVQFDLFSLLANGPLSGNEIKEKLNLNDRALYDFLDTLVALGFLTRTGLKETAIYQNSEDTDLFLDRNKPSYIGGILEMSNHRLYPFWGDLDKALLTGQPQNEVARGGKPLFEELYSDENRLKEFIKGMGGAQAGNFIKLAQTFDFSNYKTLCDVGGSGANLSIIISRFNDGIKCTSYDLPPVEPIAKENIASMNLSERVDTASGDFFQEELPKADIITMGNILHDWGVPDKKMLIKKAYNALPDNGVFIVIENIIDDERKENAFGLMMSLNMAIETPEGFDFSARDFKAWSDEAGFSRIEVLPLTGPSSAIIAYK